MSKHHIRNQIIHDEVEDGSDDIDEFYIDSEAQSTDDSDSEESHEELLSDIDLSDPLHEDLASNKVLSKKTEPLSMLNYIKRNLCTHSMLVVCVYVD